MMRKILLGLSLLTIAGLWTGCSKDEGADPAKGKQAISFRVQGGMPTATRTTATTIEDMNAFVVYGTDDKAAANIFDGVTVARKVGAGDVFDYNPKRYYSAEAANANFVAYSPVSKNITNPLTNFAGTVSFKYAVPVPTATGNTTQEDLLIAGTGNITPSPTSVSLSFEHALSRIFVKAINEMDGTVVITGLTLRNVKSVGTITGTPGATWTWSWNDTPATPLPYPYQLATTGVAVEKGVSTATLVTSMEQGMMIIPQEVTVANTGDISADFYLEVKYNVANLTDQTVNIFPLADGESFKMGKQYAITITFDSGNKIGFNITVGTFGDDTMLNL